jgi:hypothetical protein
MRRADGVTDGGGHVGRRSSSGAGVMLAISACCTRSRLAALTLLEHTLLAGMECAALTKKGQVLSWLKAGSPTDHRKGEPCHSD